MSNTARTVVLSGLMVGVIAASSPNVFGQPSIQPADSSLIQIASVFVEEGAAINSTWEGFWPDDQAFLVLRPTETALLVTPRTPPKGFTPAPDSLLPTPLKGRTYLREEYPPDLGPQTFQTRYALGQDTIPALPVRGSSLVARVEFYVHEAFHGYQRAQWTEIPGDTIRARFGERLVDASVTEDPAFRARGEVGRRILERALQVDNEDSLRVLLRDYLAVRQVRTRGHDRVRAVERRMERREGTATYVGCHAGAKGAGMPPQRAEACIRDQLTTPLDSLDNAPEADARLMRWRQYGTGAALCVVLDRLEAEGWRRAVAEGIPLDKQIQNVIAFSPSDHSIRVQNVLDRFGYSHLLKEARADS